MQLGVASPRWHDGPRLWWSNLTYSPVSYTAWHDPLISRFKGPNLPSVPELRFREAPTVPHCTLVALPAEMPTNRRWHSNFLTLSLARLQVRFILRKLGSKWGVTLPTITTERGGESIVRLFTMWKRIVRVRVSVRVSIRLHLALNASPCACVHAHTPCKHLLIPTGSLTRTGRNKQTFFPPLFFFQKTFFKGGGKEGYWYLIEICNDNVHSSPLKVTPVRRRGAGWEEEDQDWWEERVRDGRQCCISHVRA